MSEPRECIYNALKLAHRFGGIDGDHHRAWLIDQMVRALTGDDYKRWVRKWESEDDGGEWPVGIPP